MLDYVSAYLGSPIVIVKPERYELSANRFRWVWLVNRDDFFIECRYAGGKRIQVRVPSSAASCEMRAHKLGQHNYRPYSIACH